MARKSCPTTFSTHKLCFEGRINLLSSYQSKSKQTCISFLFNHYYSSDIFIENFFPVLACIAILKLTLPAPWGLIITDHRRSARSRFEVFFLSFFLSSNPVFLSFNQIEEVTYSNNTLSFLFNWPLVRILLATSVNFTYRLNL